MFPVPYELHRAPDPVPVEDQPAPAEPFDNPHPHHTPVKHPQDDEPVPDHKPYLH